MHPSGGNEEFAVNAQQVKFHDETTYGIQQYKQGTEKIR